ncbi:high affinity cGMP-specific 3',5'-cyclic phosphodiesterase 9A-like [Corticium candelabrum]|uniref:high affinity cGMP-specific 3',5'-cyclic phosphodiesterase 9A-like n=1 Tax=Corticium candelabrum TaxID=121492 RepID=UPI002E2690A7|nr:high affinity cGMP-specific 3',5'-cyclic phosphodiesterase 9A-like [Corticium candelabrum]
MGSAASQHKTKEVFIRVGDSVEKMVFTTGCSTRDFKDLLASIAGVSRWSRIVLQTSDGDHVAISPTIPSNAKSEPYLLTVLAEDSVDKETFGEVLERVAEQFSNAFQVAEMKQEMKKRLGELEKQVHADGMKLVEVEKCKRELSEVRQQLREGPVGPARCYNCASAPDGLPSPRRDIPTYSKYTLSAETMDYLKKPTFDIWHWEPNEMLSLLEHMYNELGLVEEFSINPIVLKRWLQTVQANYRNNPFHNFRHCFCVTQMMYGMIHLCNLERFMSRTDLGTLMTGCICHDLDHPGYNNAYQIKARTELAIRYNDSSPLENHHCSVAFRILAIPECNIFTNVPESKFATIRSGIIRLILATDMGIHHELLRDFQERLDTFSYTEQKDMEMLQIMLIKCCDISNEVRPMSVSEPWADCLLEENFQQGDREKREGLPVAPMMDRDKISKPQAQAGFIKGILIPLFESVAQLYPQLEDAMIAQLRRALERYESQNTLETCLEDNKVTKEQLKQQIRSSHKDSKCSRASDEFEPV